MILFAFGSAINNSIFNNYLVDVFSYTAEQRGELEIPRELPGLLVTITIGLLFFISEIRLLGLACLVAAFGIYGIGNLSPSYSSLIMWVFIWSMGVHVQMVLIERVSLEVGLAKGVGHRLGRMNGLRSMGMIMGALFVTLIATRIDMEYGRMFLCGAIAMTMGALIYLGLSRRNAKTTPKRNAFAFKKRYSRYYVLAALFGIRKQIFITFAPWFLVKILDFKPAHIANVLLISATLGMFIKPALGRLIDHWGERTILILDGIIITGFCLGYVVFPMVFKGTMLVVLCSACYILDELMFTLRTARTTWLTKIAESPEDVTGAMSVSVSVDHVLSMSISILAGYAWLMFGYQVVFLFCVIVAIAMSVVSAGIRIPQQTEPLPN